jgi:pimeloyl-ACP methyl ester carboxylesterase
VEVNGASLYFELAGAGPPVVLIHAAIADLRMWDGQFGPFSSRFRTLRWDMRGYGRSPLPDEGAPFSNRDDLRGLMEVLGIERAYLVGCSKGGETILDFALEHAEMVDALVLVGSGVGGFQFEGPEPPEWQELVAAFREGDLTRTAELEVRMWVVGHGRSPDEVDPDVLKRVREMDEIALSNEADRDGLEQALEPAALTRLAEIDAPTLIVVGEADGPEILQVSDLLAREIPGASKIVMSNAAHLPSMEHPAEFNRLVLEFLGGLSSEGSALRS